MARTTSYFDAGLSIRRILGDRIKMARTTLDGIVRALLIPRLLLTGILNGKLTAKKPTVLGFMVHAGQGEAPATGKQLIIR